MISRGSPRPIRLLHRIAASLVWGSGLPVRGTIRRRGFSSLQQHLQPGSASRSATRMPTAGPPRGGGNVSSRSCETLLRGNLVARFYYIYALDYDRGGEWSGQAFMCCATGIHHQGHRETAWRAVSTARLFRGRTAEQRSWTVQLTEANEQPSQRVPGIPGR